MPVDQIQYSERYCDTSYQYRHVILPSDLARLVPKSHLMTETEWRNLGIQQSPNWEHFMVHRPEPHVLLFRRPLTDEPQPKQMLENAWTILNWSRRNQQQFLTTAVTHGIYV